MSSAFEGIYRPGIVDPGFSSPNGTIPFWHSNPHLRANHRSERPVGVTDVTIIGTGIIGMNLVCTLLKSRPDFNIIIIDARDLCSGATGRNGGHCKTMTFAMWEERKHSFSIEETIRISAFEQAHLGAMAGTMQEDGIDCDFVLTKGIEAYYNAEDFRQAVAALEDMRTHSPHLAGKHTDHTDKTYLHNALHLSDRAVGAAASPAASFWPYK